jgi:DNA-binding beta-propeller fold protein YncE
MSALDRRTFMLGGAGVLALPLWGCGGGGGVDLPPVAAQEGPTAISTEGAQFRTQPNSHTLLVTSSKGITTQVGGVGLATGMLNYPADVAVLNELAYVVETGNHRVQIFDGTGKALGTLGDGILNYPGGIITTADEILVSDSRNARIVGFDPSGRVTRIMGEGLLSAPRGLAVVEGGLLVADPGLRKVVRLNAAGELAGVFGSDWVLPWDVATDGDLIFVADVSANEVAVLDRDARRVETIRLDKAPGYLSFRNGTLYIA